MLAVLRINHPPPPKKNGYGNLESFEELFVYFVGVQEYLFNEIIKMHPQVDLLRKNSETPQASRDQTLRQDFRETKNCSQKQEFGTAHW